MECTAQAGEGACNRHHQKNITFGRDNRVLSRLGILPTHAYLVSERRARYEKPVDNQGYKSKQQGDIRQIWLRSSDLRWKRTQPVVVEDGTLREWSLCRN